MVEQYDYDTGSGPAIVNGLTGFAKGFLNAYKDERARRDRIDENKQIQEYKKRQEELDMKDKGFTRDDKGALVMDPTSPRWRKEEEDRNLKMMELQRKNEDAVLDRQFKQAQIGKMGAETKGLLNKARGSSPQIIENEDGTQTIIPGSKGGGKTLPATTSAELGNANYIENMASDALGAIEQNKDLLGPGFLNRASSYSAQYRSDEGANRRNVFNAQMNSLAQEGGRFLEGGKLAEGDIARYRKMLPSDLDSPEVAQQKINLFMELVRKKQNEQLNALGGSGYNTSGIKRPKRGLISQNPSPSNKNGIPKQGQIEDGYEFLGGDPSDPKSWRQAR